MKHTTKHGKQLFKYESPVRRRMWKSQRRKALRHNDKCAIRDN